MNNNILNFEDGQLYLNLSIQLDTTYSSYIEALDALYSSLEDDGPDHLCIHEWHVLIPRDREDDEEGLRMHEDPRHGQDTRPLLFSFLMLPSCYLLTIVDYGNTRVFA